MQVKALTKKKMDKRPMRVDLERHARRGVLIQRKGESPCAIRASCHRLPLAHNRFFEDGGGDAAYVRTGREHAE